MLVFTFFFLLFLFPLQYDVHWEVTEYLNENLTQTCFHCADHWTLSEYAETWNFKNNELLKTHTEHGNHGNKRIEL